MEQFHVEAFEAPLLALAIYSAVAGNRAFCWPPWCCADVQARRRPLRRAPGTGVALMGHRRFGLSVASAGVVVGVAENLLLIPSSQRDPISYGSWWPFGS